MTERLYLRDPYLREFTARVVAVRPADGRTVIELDRTAFYPTSGGQLHDTGTLAGLRVVEVLDDDDGRVRHHVDAAAGVETMVGRDVTGEIDWARRFDHMQQHTGQHVLSRVALREWQAATMAVHLGEERCTVDLDLAAFGPKEAEQVEDAANAIVLENRPVVIHFVDESEIGDWGLRRPPRKSGTIRIVDIEGFDRSACGGTHVRATGEIGTSVVTGWERYKGGTRLEFLCGWRALRDHRRKTRALADLSRILSATADEMVDAVERLISRERDTGRRAEEMMQRLVAAEAELRRRGLTLPAVVAEVVPERALEEVRALAQALVRGGGLVALLAADDGRVVFARSADVALDAAALLRRITGQFGGRGGGKPELAQGALSDRGVLSDALGTARRRAEEALRGA